MNHTQFISSNMIYRYMDISYIIVLDQHEHEGIKSIMIRVFTIYRGLYIFLSLSMRKRESEMLSIGMAKKEDGVVPAGSLVLGLGIPPASLI